MNSASILSLVSAGKAYTRLARSQYWSPEALQKQADTRLAEVLRAATAIPFYRERLGAGADASQLSSYPILSRREIPALNRSVRDGLRPEVEFFHDDSSGSTGMPVEFLFDATHQAGRYAARMRYLRANGWSPLRRNAWIVAFTSDQNNNPDSFLLRTRLRGRTTFLKIFRPFEEQADALLALDPEFLYTMPSNLDGLLRVFEARRARLSALKGVFSGGEVLEESLRDRARHLLGVDIRDNYGSTEGFIAWQCPTGSYHINVEHVAIEIVDEYGAPATSGQMGKVLVTTLENRLMPLIRYEIGDYAIASSERCSCGRTLPLMGKVIGRGINLFRMPDGRLLSPWPLIGPLKARAMLQQFQVVQETFDHYVVRYVADREVGREAEEQIAASFAKTLATELTVSFEKMESIPRTAGGKFMTALSLIRN